MSNVIGIKAIVESYLLLIQFELDDGGVKKPYGDQKMTRECYYVSLKFLRRKKNPSKEKICRQNKLKIKRS